jgi:hypothetical protein
MGHADIQTTMRYLHYAPHSEDAELVAKAFRLPQASASGEADPPIPDVRRSPKMSGDFRPAG